MVRSAGWFCRENPLRRPTPARSGKIRLPARPGFSCEASRSNQAPPSSVEQLERRLMHALVASRDDAAAARRRAAFPRGDGAAGAGDNRDQWGDIVGLEFGFDDEIEMACSKHAIRIAVATV